MSGQLDQVSQSIGKIQGTLEAHGSVHNQILVKLDNFERNLNKKFEEYDNHIEALNEDMQQRRGARAVMVGFAGFIGAAAMKVFDLVIR